MVLSFGASLPASADGGSSTFIPAALLSQAQANPNGSYKVIVQGNGSDDADHVAHKVAQWAADANHDAQDAAKKAADDLAKAQKDLASAQADATTKAAKAKKTGKKDDQAAAQKAAQALTAAQGTVAQDNAAVTATAGTFEQDPNKIARDQVRNEFNSITGVAVTLTGRQISKIYEHGKDGLLSITPDAPAKVSGGSFWSSDQLWPYESGAVGNWVKDRFDSNVQANVPAIAIVDSGIQDRADFGSRLVASVNLSTLPNNSPGDGRGHGTFVAGIAADSAPDYSGTSPISKLVSIDVMDDSGIGLTSDIVNACQWILDHQAQYNIKVANFSLHSAITAPFFVDPLDRAVEQLWFHGITVVVAAGNYGTAGGPSGVLYSPGDDPFVITVGAADLGGSPKPRDDSIAPWSAWGYTIDGFAKPEVAAPGRYMVGPVPANATLIAEKPGNVTAPGYMQLSGTSFAAPIVAGTAADILARHPNFTPDQVKGALMFTARYVPLAVGFSAGVGEITANAAAAVGNPPNPNLALDAFVKAGTFDSSTWLKAVQSSVSWNSVSWNSVSWNSVSWNSASWNDVSWNSASWNDVSWNSVSWNSASWNDASWNDASHEDAAEGDSAGDASTYTLDAADVAALFSDPSLGVDPALLPDTVAASESGAATVPTSPPPATTTLAPANTTAALTTSTAVATSTTSTTTTAGLTSLP